jgi:hypothetical protein
MIAIRRMVIWAGAHAWLGWLLCLPILFKFAQWGTDNVAPFELLATTTVVPGPPGGEVLFESAVRRDLHRECSVRYSRHIVDSRGFRHDFEMEPRYLSADGLRRMDKDMGQRLKIVVNIPKAAAVGPAIYAAELNYVCNPLHTLFPLRVTMAMPFDVLPAPVVARP